MTAVLNRLQPALFFLAQQFWFDLLPADISKVMQAKKKRLECLTKNYMKGSQHKLEQLWKNYHAQRFDFILSLTEGKSATASNCHVYWLCVCCICRQKITHQYSQQVSSALQQWEAEAQRAEEQEEKLNVGSLLYFWLDRAAGLMLCDIQCCFWWAKCPHVIQP